MTPAQTYKMYAAIAVDMVAETTDPARRASLLEMAQLWQDLADKEEQPPASQIDTQAQQPAQQQQQQPQQDNDNDE